jgi:hypothetical protein
VITHTFETANGDICLLAVQGAVDMNVISQPIAEFVDGESGVLLLDLRGTTPIGRWRLAELVRLGRLFQRRHESVVTVAPVSSPTDRLATFVASWLQPVHRGLADAMADARHRLAVSPPDDPAS